MRVAIGISGASGVELGMKAYRLLPPESEKYLIVSSHATLVASKEEGTLLDNANIGACTASGSFGLDAFLVIPCSMNSLAKISVGIADNLLTRTAAVQLKERRTLLLAPREIPFNGIALENMARLERNGAIIAPPVLGYYAGVQTLEEMENFLIGRWFDMVGIKNTLYTRWEGK